MNERRLAIAGLGVRVRFDAAPIGVLLDAAYGHLAADLPPVLDVTVLVGETAKRAIADTDPSTHWNHGDRSVTVPDYARGTCLQLIPDFDAVPAWARAAPMRSLLGRWLWMHQRYLVHAAAIGTPAGGVLLAGKGGSGKSTAALACLDAFTREGSPRLAIGGDDFVVLDPDRRRAHPLLATAKLERTHAQRFPGLAPLVARGGPLDDPTQKAVLRLWPDAAERLLGPMPIRAVVAPALRLEARDSSIERMSRADALLALAPSSIFLMPGAGEETMQAIVAVVASLPAYRLLIGSDPTRIPAALEELVGERSRPNVSVLIPVYQGARFVGQAIESARAQTCGPLEIIVVDDGSTDGSAEVAARYPDVQVIRQENRGPGAARNRAFQASRGDFVAYLDADDLWEPDKIERQLARLEARPEAGWLICKHRFLMDEGEARPRWAPDAEAEKTIPAYLPSALLITRACFEATRGFDETIRYGEDLDWFTRARDRGYRGAMHDAQLLIRRVHRTNMMHTHTDSDFQNAIAAIVRRKRAGG